MTSRFRRLPVAGGDRVAHGYLVPPPGGARTRGSHVAAGARTLRVVCPPSPACWTENGIPPAPWWIPPRDRAEHALRFIESPAWVGAFCLKKPERMAALGEVLLRAAIVYPLRERHVRRALAHPGQPPVRGLNNHPTQSAHQPTRSRGFCLRSWS